MMDNVMSFIGGFVTTFVLLTIVGVSCAYLIERTKKKDEDK